MFDRMANGWELTKQSFRVLILDKELLLFPLFSGFSCLIVLASFAVPLWNSEYAGVVLNERAAPDDALAYVILFAFYFVNYFVIVFFNSALIACAIIRFNGGNPTLGDGFSKITPDIRLGAGLRHDRINPESHQVQVGTSRAIRGGAAWHGMVGGHLFCCPRSGRRKGRTGRSRQAIVLRPSPHLG